MPVAARVTQVGVLVSVRRSPVTRVTQAGAIVSVRRSPVTRVTQAGAIVSRSKEVHPNACVTQVGALVARSYALTTPAQTKVTQVGALVSRSVTSITTSRATQVGALVSISRAVTVHVTQVGVLVSRSRVISTVGTSRRARVTQVGALISRSFHRHARVTQVGILISVQVGSRTLVTQVGALVSRSMGVLTASPPVLAHASDPDVTLSGPRVLLYEGVSGRFPFDMIETAEGDLVLVNGVDYPLIWTQRRGRAQRLGMPAPFGAPVLTVAHPHVFTPGTDTVQGGDVVNTDGTIRRVTSYRVISGVTFQPTASAGAGATAPNLPEFVATKANHIPFSKTGVRISPSRIDWFAVNVAENLAREYFREQWGVSGGTLTPTGLNQQATPSGLFGLDYVLFTAWLTSGVLENVRLFDPVNKTYFLASASYSGADDHICTFTEAQVAWVIGEARKAFRELAVPPGPPTGVNPAQTALQLQEDAYTTARYEVNRLLNGLCDGSIAEPTPADTTTQPDVQDPVYQVVGFTGDLLAQTIHGRLYAAVRFLDEEGHPSDFSPLGIIDLSLDRDYFDVVPQGDGTFLIPQIADALRYSSMPTSDDPRVARRQILRTLDGDANTYYVDIDTRDLTSGSLTSSRVDADLIANAEAVPLFDADDRPVAYSHGSPPDFRRALTAFLGRVFLAGGVQDRQGSVAVTNGSRVVVGAGTEWKTSYARRVLRVSGVPGLWLIDSVDPVQQTMTLETVYDGPSGLHGYTVDPPDAERRTIYWSEPGDVWSWPATNAVAVTETGDEIVGLFAMNSYLYIVESRHIHRATSTSDPTADLSIYLGPERGCVNHRCIVRVEDTVYLLDEQGVYRMSSLEQIEDVSLPIRDLFRGTNPELAIDWAADRTLWFGAYDALRSILRWFVTFRGREHTCLAFSVERKAWWLESYSHPVLSGSLGTLGAPRTIVGLPGRQIGVLDSEPLLGSPGAFRSVLLVMDAGPVSLTFDFTALANRVEPTAPQAVTIVEGTGAGQTRAVASVDGDRLETLVPWNIIPDATSRVVLDAMPWLWRSGWFRFVTSPLNNQRDIEIVHQPLQTPGPAWMTLTFNHAATPRVWRQDYNVSGVQMTEGSDRVGLDLGREDGVLVIQAKGHGDPNAARDRYIQIAMMGYAGTETVVIYEVTINGVESG
jgi:hypothetical protein